MTCHGSSQGYDGKVAADIDHKAYMPAAWRVDEYLDGDDDISIADLGKHALVFARAPNPGDDMARDMDRDDLEVRFPEAKAPWFGTSLVPLTRWHSLLAP